MRFLLILLLYAGIQAYFGYKTVHGLDANGWLAISIWLWAALMAIGPMLHWRLERCEQCRLLAVLSAWVIFGWMGFVFLFFWVGISLDLASVIAHWMGYSMPTQKVSLTVISGISLLVWAWGFWIARHPRLVSLSVTSEKLPPGSRLRIVQISDLHLGLLINRNRLRRLLRRLEEVRPDLLVSTGDLVDAEAHFLDGLSEEFSAYQPPLGKYAVTGNHERYAGTSHSLWFHQQCGFKVLRGTSIDVTDRVTLAGVDDPAVDRDTSIEAGLTRTISPDRFVLLLKHQPVLEARSRFDLQLSGHTHNGQIFPFGLLVKLVYAMSRGRYRLPDNQELYVSSGTGTWGPPIRVLAPGEITLIELSGR